MAANLINVKIFFFFLFTFNFTGSFMMTNTRSVVVETYVSLHSNVVLLFEVGEVTKGEYLNC